MILLQWYRHYSRSLDRRLLQLFILAGCLLLLSSCVYLRLLDFKNQLLAFDENFSVEANDAFILHFHDPMMYNRDMIRLSKLQPTKIEKNDEGEIWTYRFEKLSPSGEQASSNDDIIFYMTFNQKSKLTDWEFSPVFLQIVPADFLETSLRMLGSAEVDQKNRRMRADFSSTPKVDLVLPERKTVEEKLGVPFKKETAPGELILTYKYELDTESAGEKAEENKISVASLRFDTQTDQLIGMKGRFAGLKISIDYRKLSEKAAVPTE